MAQYDEPDLSCSVRCPGTPVVAHLSPVQTQADILGSVLSSRFCFQTSVIQMTNDNTLS